MVGDLPACETMGVLKQTTAPRVTWCSGGDTAEPITMLM